MAGGQAFTASAGSVGRTLTLALAGIALTSAQGTASPNNEGIVPLVGEASITAQQTIAPSWAQDLSGSASTGAAGTVGVNQTPTQVVGQEITGATGTLSASGSSVTVNISGVEITALDGIVTGGTEFLTGIASTSAQGSPTISLTLPLVGLETISAHGIVAAAQEAVDTLMTAGLSSMTPSLSIALTGLESVSAAGAVSITSDAEIQLTGQAVTVVDGIIGYGEEFPISGSSITSAQQSMGAPGGVTLSGIAVAVSAGDVFTTNDRTFALFGEAITAQSGATFASPLAFMIGQELTAAAQVFGPREVFLAGLESPMSQGNLQLPVPVVAEVVAFGGFSDFGTLRERTALRKKKPKIVNVDPPVLEEVKSNPPELGTPVERKVDVVDELAKKREQARKRRKKIEEELLLM